MRVVSIFSYNIFIVWEIDVITFLETAALFLQAVDCLPTWGFGLVRFGCRHVAVFPVLSHDFDEHKKVELPIEMMTNNTQVAINRNK